MAKRFYLAPDEVLINLLAEDLRSFVYIQDVFEFCKYIIDQLKTDEYINKYELVTPIITFDAIERTVRYNDRVFDLVGNRIYLRREIPQSLREINHVPLDILKIFKKFTDSKLSYT
ncbi:MAG: hypothetical protein HFJ21_07055 [Clostridia bacterium]|nr:hypothetical protein [Clostridia bacterium]MCI9460182.1 hypothetical protein [Clostridia bacterium]